MEAVRTTAAGGGARRRRSVGPTAALGAVLLALAAYVILATLTSANAAQRQAQVLAIDALFAEARTAVALEEVHLRHYQVEPSVAVRVRFSASAERRHGGAGPGTKGRQPGKPRNTPGGCTMSRSSTGGWPPCSWPWSPTRIPDTASTTGST